VLLLDTGNLFFRKPSQTETKQKDGFLRAELLIQAYNEMGYDAVNVGEKDLMEGLKFLTGLAPKARFPFVSANLVERKTGESIFSPYVIKEIAGIKVGILGLMSEVFDSTVQEREHGFHILDPFTTSRSLIKNLKENCDLLIVLSQLGEMRDKRLAKENPQIDLVLGGGGESKRAVNERVNEVPVYRLEPRGGYLGRIDYFLSHTQKPIKFIISQERDEIEKRLDRVIQHLNQIKSERVTSGKSNGVRAKELKYLESKQKELEKTLFTFEDKNFYRHAALPVQLTVKDDPKIVRGLESYRAESAKLFKTKAAISTEKELPEKEMIARIPKESPLIGAISCKKCHALNYQNWLKTKHAKATQTITSSPKYSQEECLICHSTGYGKMGDYVTAEDIPFYLRGVQCEACHGEGRRHPGKGGISRKVTLGVCRNCHTKDQSPAFNYVAYLEKVGCQISK
jgi:hypothetical protein